MPTASLIPSGNVLAWIAAIGGVLATIGAWAGPLRARWNLRAEELRTGRAQHENRLHRWRYPEVWEWITLSHVRV